LRIIIILVLCFGEFGIFSYDVEHGLWKGRKVVTDKMSSYCEAIETLYTKNGFYFNNLEEILRFSLVLPPGRMQWIRNVAWVDDYKTYYVAGNRE